MPALGHQEGPGGEEEAAEAAAWRMTQLERQAGWRRRRRRVSGGGRGAPEEQGGTSGGAILVPGRNKRVHGGRRGGCDGNDSGHLLVTTSGSLASSASATASASASCGRCSSGSDHEALFSQLSLVCTRSRSPLRVRSRPFRLLLPPPCQRRLAGQTIEAFLTIKINTSELEEQRGRLRPRRMAS